MDDEVDTATDHEWDFTIVIRQDEDGRFEATCEEIEHVRASGDLEADVVEDIKRQLVKYVSEKERIPAGAGY